MNEISASRRINSPSIGTGRFDWSTAEAPRSTTAVKSENHNAPVNVSPDFNVTTTRSR